MRMFMYRIFTIFISMVLLIGDNFILVSPVLAANVTIRVNIRHYSPVADFSAQPGYSKDENSYVDLSWKNPEEPVYNGTVITFRTDDYPLHQYDGTEIYNSTGTYFRHRGLAEGTTYYYAAFAYNQDNLYSLATRVKGITPVLSKVEAVIRTPRDGMKVIGKRLMVMAELVRGSVSGVKHILFEYKSTSTTEWLKIPAPGNPDSSSPYSVRWDISKLAEGNYNLRAKAFDIDDVSDLDPPYITVSVVKELKPLGLSLTGQYYFNSKEPQLSIMITLVEGVSVQYDTIQTFIDNKKVSFTYDPKTGELIIYPEEELAEGLHTFTFSAFDSENRKISLTGSFFIDTLPPEIEDAREVVQGNKLWDGDYIDPYEGISFVVTDEGSGLREESVIINIGDAFSLNVNGNTGENKTFLVYKSGSSQWQVEGKPGDTLPDGVYTITLYAEDMAGNATRSEALRVVIAGNLRMEDVAVYPNPARRDAKFAFQISKQTEIKIEIYTLTGELVRTLNGRSVAGYNELVWDLTNDWGKKIASGLYHYRVTAEDGQNRVREVKSMAVKR